MSKENDKPEESVEEAAEENVEEVSEEAAQEETVEEEAVDEVVEEPKKEVSPLSRPEVIDFSALAKPISTKAPSGESVRYSGVYDEINEARRADDDLSQGEWQTELKVADFPKVIELATAVLEKQSKDLQVAAWFSEGLVKLHGFAGLRDSLRMMTILQKNFWDTMFPEIEDGDMEGRANAIAWMDKQAAFAIKEAPITDGEGHSYLGWEDSKKFDIPTDIESLETEQRQKALGLKEQAERENRTTTEQWKKAVAQSKRAFYEEVDVAIQECWENFYELNELIEEKYDRNQAPSLMNLKKSLENVQGQTNILLKQKREEEPDPADDMENEEGATDGGGGSKKGGSLSASGAIQNRRDALRRLSELASFFRKTEPHSPVSYLVSRAVKWGNMPLEIWLQDVIKDEGTLFQIRQTLGFNTADAAPHPQEPVAQGGLTYSEGDSEPM